MTTTLYWDTDPTKIYLCLDSNDGDYAAVTGALTIHSTTNASHDSTIKVIVADDPGARTGSLAPIARSALGTGVFCDEYVGFADYKKRGWPLIGQGPYADNFWHIRPRVVYESGTGVATRVTSYGDANGKTYRDAFAGPEDWNNNKGGISGTPAVQLYGEHILRWEDQQLDGPIGSHGVIDFDFSGDSETPAAIYYDHPQIDFNGYTFDHAVTYGGLVLEDADQDWTQGIVAMPYTAGTALVSGDKGLTITMDTDGDTGTLLDYDGSTIWIGTDGTAGNSFDNSPTSNDSFTITSGTGTGSQNGAASSVSNLWWLPTRPATDTGDSNWFRDFGSHFGNPVDINGNTTFTKLDGLGNTLQETVSTAVGHGGIVSSVSTISDCISTEDSHYTVGSTSKPIVVHIVDGDDPTHRVMNGSYGARYGLDAAQTYITVAGERSRINGHSQTYPLSNWTLTDWSRVEAGNRARAFYIQLANDVSDYLVQYGYVGNYGSGFYPVASNDYIIDGITIQHFVAQTLGDSTNPDSDAHAVGFQTTCKNLTLEYFIFLDTGGAINLYQSGSWITHPSLHQWGTITISYGHIDGTPAYFRTNHLTNDAGVHFAGDNDDEAQSGNGGASPPTDVTSFDATVTAVLVNDKDRNFRSKWRDTAPKFRNCLSTNPATEDINIAGTDPGDGRSGQIDWQNCEAGTGSTSIWSITPADGYQVIADNNVYNVLAASAYFDGDTFANWQARVRSGDTYDPNSTRQDP